MDNTVGDDFLGLCEKKVSYKHILDFGFFFLNNEDLGNHLLH